MKGNDRIIFAIGLAALTLLLYSIFPKIGLTYDSHLYLELSGNLGSQGFAQQSFGSKPPLYPILLWLLQSNLTAISVLNVLCWMFSLILSYRVFIQKIDDEFLKISLAVVLFLSTPLIMVHNFVWTEPPFILAVLTFLFLAHQEESTKCWIIQSLLLLAIVSLKHLGIVLVAGFAVVTIWKERNIKKSFILYSLPLLFFLLWQYKSFLIRGDFSRLDHTSDLSLIQNMEWIGNTFLHWFLPFQTPSFISAIVTFIVFAYLAFQFLKSDTRISYSISIPVFLLPLIITKADLLEADLERYFSVAFPSLLFLLFLKLSEKKWSNHISLRIAVLLFVAYSVIRAIKNGIFWH